MPVYITQEQYIPQTDKKKRPPGTTYYWKICARAKGIADITTETVVSLIVAAVD